jgi:hypothetical protein
MSVDVGPRVGLPGRLRGADDAGGDEPRWIDAPLWQSFPHVRITGTSASMLLAPRGGGFHVFGPDGGCLYDCRGAAPRAWHQFDFVQSVRARTAPPSGLGAVRGAATLLHLANASFRAGRVQVAYDWVSGRIVNDRRADAFLHEG